MKFFFFMKFTFQLYVDNDESLNDVEACLVLLC